MFSVMSCNIYYIDDMLSVDCTHRHIIYAYMPMIALYVYCIIIEFPRIFNVKQMFIREIFFKKISQQPMAALNPNLGWKGYCVLLMF